MTFLVPYFMGERVPGLDAPPPRTVIEPELPAGSPQERMAVLYTALADAVARTEAPQVWAGDCVSSLGVVARLQRRGIEPTLVWFDAHGDFNTWETTPSGFLGGMPLAMAVGRGEQTIVAAAGMAPLPEERAVLVGARDLDLGEDEAVAASAMTGLSVAEAARWKPPPGPLYLHVDVDVVDPADMPAMNYPAPDGPSAAETAAALVHLAATGRVVAASFSLWNPALPGAAQAEAACRRLAAALA